MNECVLPTSPNWFLSSVSSGNDAGLYAFGAKSHVYVYDVSEVVMGEMDPQSQFVGDDDSDRGSVSLLNKVPRLISAYTEHEQKVCAVCLCPDPEQLICCSADEMFVKLWDVPSRTLIQTHNYHNKEKITCMTWSPCDVDLVMTASEKGTVVLWKLKSNTVTSFQPQRDYIYCMKASPHSAALVAIGYRSSGAMIVNVAYSQPQILQKLRGFESEITSICWCPVAGENILDIAAGHPGTLLAAAGGKLIKVWDSTTGKEVYFKKLQSSATSRSNSQDPTIKKQWLDIQWLKSSPDYLISSSVAPQGDLFLWNLHSRTQQEPELFDTSSINKHLRVIFNITPVGDKICTFSLDRIIALWDLKSQKGIVSWFSFGGFPYCIRASPVDPGMVAIGAGDNTIRVWNQNNRSRPFDVTSLCYGARSMITSVAWHPEREGLLAFGTDDGRVGVINALTVKPPLMSSTSHKRTVYVVCWGPPVHSGTGSSHQYQVYSIGDGTVLQHSIGESGSKKDAVNLIEAIIAANGPDMDNVIRSEIIWKRDYTAFVIGCDNGSVFVYNFPGLKQVFAIKIHRKMINCLRWHPEMTAESVHGSPCRNWVAIAGNDRHISIVDLPSLFVDAQESSFTPTTITNAFCQLPGHLVKTTDMCWSPHHDGRLVSVGYDRIAIVWNVKNGEGLASFTAHEERLLTVLWSCLDPDLIITGGFDATLRVWRVSAQSKTVIDMNERKKKKKKASNNGSGISYAESVSNQGEINASEQEIKELQDLLVAKQQQLLSKLKIESANINGSDGSADQLEDNDRYSINGKQVPSGGLGNERRKQQSHESGNTTVDSTANSTVTFSTSRPSDDSRFTVTTGGGTALVSQPSAVIASGTDGTSLVAPSQDNNQSPRGAKSYASPATSVHENGNRDNGNESDDVDDLNTIPSVADLVPPVKPLFPKSGFNSNDLHARQSSVACSTGVADKSKKRKLKLKSLFPVTSSANNRGKAAQQEDLLDLSRIIAGQESADIIDKKPHLGLFVDKLGAHRCLLQESEHHLSHDNMEYHLQLELWRGNVAGAIQIARQRNELSDWIVSMAPLASHDLWEMVSAEYAEQLEDDGQYHKAATYLLAAHKVYQAVDLFRRHKLFREAVSLAKIRLSPIDPVLEDLYTDWGQNLMKEGQYEQAAKCYLAMRQIQEAAKVVTRRQDQSSLKTACHMTLLANEKQQGLIFAYKLFSQYLMMGEWQEAHKFISEHDSLKILLPVLYVHETLIKHLVGLCPGMTFTQKQVTPEMFCNWEHKETQNKKTELPEFLLDRSDTDPVIPWEPFLIGEHTFPHQVLRGWYHHLDMAMVTQELKAMHAVISQLVSHRHSMVDQPSLMVMVSVDITLCLLALLTSETSTAIIHLLQALSTLHNSTYASLQQALCRLMLPQGPKYLLKLQREFNASRVLITMESQGDVDAGGERHNSTRKFMTDIKDDKAISMSAVRCRELDCLRAYCYLAILDYLREKDPHSQTENDSLDGMPNGSSSAVENILHILQTKTEINDELKIRIVDKPEEDSCSLDQACSKLHFTASKGHGLKTVHDQNICDLDQNGKLSHAGDSPAVGHPLLGKGDASESISDSSNSDQQLTHNNSPEKSLNNSCYKKPLSQEATPIVSSPTSQSLLEPSSEPPFVDHIMPSNIKILSLKMTNNGKSPTDAKSALSQSYNTPTFPLKIAGESSGKTPGVIDELSQISSESSESPSNQTVICGHLNYLNLLRLSKGILWDVQAKREALTETLGYVHQAISQQLLFHRSENDNNQCDPGSEDLCLTLNNKSFQQAVSHELEEDGSCHRTRLLLPSPSREPETASSLISCESEIASDISRSHTSNIVCDNSRTTSTHVSSGLEHARSLSPQPTDHAMESSQKGSLRSLSDNCCTYRKHTSASSKLEQSLALPSEQELLAPVASDPVTFQKSRKVLWMDGRGCEDVDSGNKESAFQISRLAPDGNPIPLEWDSLPVDMKYAMPYISLALLRQEQESISQELKRVPDCSRVSFPATAGSVKKLLHTSLRSPHLSRPEKCSYLKQLNDWATVFAITSHQQTEMEAMFAAASFE